jgi:AAA+ ATPase superfamily predicted ATPase
VVAKPDKIFDRTAEWSALTSYAADPQPLPTLGVVSGRRRQGKTYLLAALAESMNGFYFAADEATAADALRRFSAALAEFSGSPVQFADWDSALAFLIAQASNRPAPLIIDEFPLLMRASPELPSLIQRHIDRHWSAGEGPAARLLLCGSAMSVMGGLLSGQSPLRGRAGLEIVVRPLPYREAATFWGIRDPQLAALVFSAVGGTPAYRRQFVRDDSPADMEDFDGWVCRTLLNPQLPIFREARYLLAEEVPARDPGLYHSVLGAIADGNTTNGGIASYVGRRSAEIAHPLNVLEDCALISKNPDIFRKGRSAYRICEPLVTFYQAVMRPRWPVLELGGAERAWADAAPTFLSHVVGPSFEQTCRSWALITPGVFPELPAEVGSGVITDPAAKAHIQIDVAVLAAAEPGRPRRVLSLGEVKWGKQLGTRHLRRLRRAGEVLQGQGYDTTAMVLGCYSGSGFDADLIAAAATDESILLVDAERLYR